MTTLVLADNAYGTLGSGLAVGDTTLTFTSGHGARFPAVPSGSVLYCCLLNSNNVLEEIIVILHVAGADTATITRAAGNTTAKAWSAGDRIEARVSATVLTVLGSLDGVAADGANTDITSLGVLTSINGNAIAGLYNVLINPAFAHDQRNAGASTAIADDTYCFDRWYALTQTGTVAASQLTDPENGYTNALRLTQSQASAQRFGIAQIVEGKYCKRMRGGAATLVPRIRCSSSQAIRYAILEWTSTEDSVTSDVVLDWTSASYIAGGFFLASNLTISSVGTVTPSAATWTSLTKISPTLGSAFNNLIVMIWTEGTAAQNVTLDFDYVQLESGSIATAPERRTPLELMMCQRYLPAITASSVSLEPIGLGQALSTTQVVVPFPFQVPPRVPPTGASVSNAAHFATSASNGATTSASAVSVSQVGKVGANLSFTTTGVVAGNASIVYSQSASAQILLTGCEL